MNNTPLVSVIIPTHNRPDFLKKTIQSILNQTYKILEVIVVSNGFSINNKMAVQEFNDSRLKYVEQENSGTPASPRNHGIKLAKGEYIAFCDDDDLWMQGKIEKQVLVLKENCDYGLCYTKMIRFDEKKEWIRQHEEGLATLKSLLYVNVVPISSVVVRKSLIDEMGGFLETQQVGNSEDYELLLRYSTVTKFYFLNEYLIKYWSGSNRTTNNNFSLNDLISNGKDVFSCYGILWKANKIKLYQLVLPCLNILISNFKILCYQFITKFSYKNII